MRLLLFGTAAALQLIASAPASAGGFYLQEQSVRGWGRANSGEVADTGAGSLWWNPAAIGGIDGHEATFGLTGVLPSGRVSNDGTLIDRPGAAPAPVGGQQTMRDPVLKGALPTNAAALRISDRIALGLAVSSPFSFTTDYDEDGWQRYSTIRTRLITIDLQPSVAVQATDWLSLGAGLNLEYSDAYLSSALPNLAPGSEDGKFILKGKGWDLGWSAGLQLRPAERLTIGLAYKSAVKHHLKGSVEIRGLAGPLAARNLEAPTTVDFTTPWQLIAGARAGVTERTTLNVQVVHFGWSEFGRLDLGAPLNSFIPQGYKDTWSFAFGVDQRMSEALTLRAGIQFDGTPTRDIRRDPRVPDADRVTYAAGGSLRVSHRLTLEGAASLTDFESSVITRDEIFYAGTPAQTEVLSNGRASNQRALVLSLGGRMEF
ncbi:MAG: OmpP1/FadL family transporter [Allosphingosinicella sp.]